MIDPCFAATYRFVVDGGEVTKYDLSSGRGIYRATAVMTIMNSDPTGFDGYVRQTETATVTGGEITWNTQDIFICK